MSSDAAGVFEVVGDPADLDLAQRLADLSDAISLDRYLANDLVVETKPDTTPVTDADRAGEKLIRETLAKERPSDLIIGEEFGGLEKLVSAAEGSRFWIIDPIDGTKNFLRGVPTWATLIALAQITSAGPKVIVGVVSSPAL
ncbi:MAG: inositol monophosphatase family protein, partial [bacterium]